MDGPDDIARLIYLLVLLVFVGSWFASDLRNRLSQTLQMAAIWVLIFMGAIAAYSFRDVIGGELFTSAPRVGPDGALSVTRQGDGHFYIDLMANGQKITFAVDTGATDIVLTLRDAERAGLDPAMLDFTGEAGTANGVVRTAPARLDTFGPKGMESQDVAVSVNQGELDQSLLGMAWLRRYGRISIEGDKMVFQP